MNLTERLNVLIQAATLSQKSGIFTLDEAFKAKLAIDVISSGTLTQDFATSINTLIELAIASQKNGGYSLKDAHMIYLAIEGIEEELKNEVNRINEEMRIKQTPQEPNGESTVTIPPKKLKKQS